MLISRRESGFTLIEIMVVLVIIAILGALIAPQIIGQVDEARVKATRLDIRTLGTALDLYQMDNFRYPSSEQSLEALVKKPTVGTLPPNWKPYVDKLPNDPWGRPYQYANPGVKGEIDVYSMGADGQAGGEGKNAEVGSWQ